MGTLARREHGQEWPSYYCQPRATASGFSREVSFPNGARTPGGPLTWNLDVALVSRPGLACWLWLFRRMMSPCQRQSLRADWPPQPQDTPI